MLTARMLTSTPASPHRWRFFRAGGLEQVRIETGADIAHLDELDQKLWVALACPVRGLEFDEKTLALIDSDADGRVRVPEILQAIAFCRDALKNLDGLLAGTDRIPLASLNAEQPAGKAILASAQKILDALGKSTDTIGLDEVSDTQAVFAKTRFNGDGIIIVDSSDAPAIRQVIAEALEAVGSVADRSGAPGLSTAHVDAFFAELAALDAWTKTSETDAATLLPLGERTAAAVAAYLAVQAKIDDYFTRCRLAQYDARAGQLLNHEEAEYAALGAKDLSASASELAGFPLARIEAGRALPLRKEVNPAWAAALAQLNADTLAPLLGAERDTLSEAEWKAVSDRLAPHVAWAAAKPVTKAEALGIDRVRAILTSDVRAELERLIEVDRSFEAEFNGIANVEKLARYHRDLFRLLHNFTSFTDFYRPDRPAVFQAGTLFLDSRACELCIRVDDPGKHAAMAGLAKCYLAYCDCVRTGGEKMQIAAVFSGGDNDYLMVGRNGVFYDRQGRDWDATIVKVVDNPISLRAAFFSPYKSLVRMVEEQVAKRAAAAGVTSNAKLSTVAEVTANVDKTAPPKPGIDLSTIALIGVAVSGAAAVVGAILEAFFGLGIWMPLGIVGLALAISGPSVAIAALKLRHRNLGPILDANGWAINGRVAVNIPFGGTLTQLRTFPAKAERSLIDPYQPKKSLWGPVLYAAGALILGAGATVFSYHQGWLPAAAESRFAVLGVPKHLRIAKELAQVSVDEAKVVLTSAQEQLAFAQQTHADLVAAGVVSGTKLDRAEARLGRAEAKVARAEDRLDGVEQRLELATEALDAAIDADEARVEAAEAAVPVE